MIDGDPEVNVLNDWHFCRDRAADGSELLNGFSVFLGEEHQLEDDPDDPAILRLGSKHVVADVLAPGLSGRASRMRENDGILIRFDDVERSFIRGVTD
jgi:hypothetical protein